MGQFIGVLWVVRALDVSRALEVVLALFDAGRLLMTVLVSLGLLVAVVLELMALRLELLELWSEWVLELVL